MIPRHLKITFALLVVAACATTIYVWNLKRHVELAPPPAAELERPVAPPPAGASTPVVLFVAHDQEAALRREAVSLTLPQESSQRAQAVLRALLARYAAKDSPHPMPAGADVNDVYVVKGTAVIDVNAPFANGHRSGVLVEELTLLSLVQTLSATLPRITQVKILVDGKERDTLAGHADLADFYDVAAVARLAEHMTRAAAQPSAVHNQQSASLGP